jgi:xanthine/CO dehydrogenase XdhC/CoxF family maturation factor
MERLRLDTSLETLLERHRALRAPCALATIIATEGSTYRKAGARMLIEANGRVTGLLSGGCFELDLGQRARRVLDSGQPLITEYDMRINDDLIFGIGAGCEGMIRVLVEDATAGGRTAQALEIASRATHGGSGAALLLGVTGEPTALGTRAWSALESSPLDSDLTAACRRSVERRESQHLRLARAGAETTYWIQYVAPTPRVLVCGGGPDAEPLVALLAMLGMNVTLVDHRPAHAVPERFPRAHVVLSAAAALASAVDLGQFSAAIVMSHHLASDSSYLRALAASSVPYVGVLGPRPRRERLLRDLDGAGAALATRLRGPIGLDIGAVTPEGIALAIAAEVHAFAAGRSGGAMTPPASSA